MFGSCTLHLQLQLWFLMVTITSDGTEISTHYRGGENWSDLPCSWVTNTTAIHSGTTWPKIRLSRDPNRIPRRTDIDPILMEKTSSTRPSDGCCSICRNCNLGMWRITPRSWWEMGLILPRCFGRWLWMIWILWRWWEFMLLLFGVGCCFPLVVVWKTNPSWICNDP